MKLICCLLCLLCTHAWAQAPEYTSAHYAASGDTFYFSQANPTNLPDFSQTGENQTWDFTELGDPLTQRRLIYRLPSQAGYSFFEFPYINIPGNVNLAATDGDTLSLAGYLTMTDVYDFFHKNTSRIEQRATAYSINVGGLPVPLRISYSQADVIYKFPVRYDTPDSSISRYTTQLPSIYYIHRWQKRVNNPEAWGSLTTPYGTFDCLKLRVDIRRYDSLSISGIGIPADTLMLREYVWLSPAHKQPVLRIVQTRIGGNYITQQVEYLDDKQCLTPLAIFAYLPLTPTTADEVQFQNLSLNAEHYSWDFGDGHTSNQANPRHQFADQGTYDVTLTVGTCQETANLTLPVTVGFPTNRATNASQEDIRVVNPVQAHQLELRLGSPAHLDLRDMLGRQVMQAQLHAGVHTLRLPAHLRGCYLLHLTDAEGAAVCQRIVLP